MEEQKAGRPTDKTFSSKRSLHLFLNHHQCTPLMCTSMHQCVCKCFKETAFQRINIVNTKNLHTYCGFKKILIRKTSHIYRLATFSSWSKIVTFIFPIMLTIFSYYWFQQNLILVRSLPYRFWCFIETAGFWPQCKVLTKLRMTRIQILKVNYGVAYKTQAETWYIQA